MEATLTTTDGRTLHIRVEHAIGSLGRPLTDAELDAKVRDLSEPIIGADKTGALIAAARAVRAAPDLRAVIAAGVA